MSRTAKQRKRMSRRHGPNRSEMKRRTKNAAIRATLAGLPPPGGFDLGALALLAGCAVRRRRTV